MTLPLESPRPAAGVAQPQRTGDGALLRAIGGWALTAGIVNVTIGGGIFRLPAGAAAVLGSSAPIAYIVCAVAMGLIVLCFADAGSRVPLTGSVYAYVEVAFGPCAGFITGVMLWVGVTLAVAAVSAFMADSLGALLPVLAPPGRRALVLVLVLAALTVLNIRGVRQASRFNTVMTIAKLVPLGLLIVGGAFAVHAENLRWTRLPAPGDVARASTLLLFAFLGVETALVPGGEVRDPARTVPRAIFAAMAIVTTIYLSVHLVTQGILGAALSVQPTPLATAGGVAFGAWGRLLILVGSTISMFGYVSGMMLAVPRMLFAFARDGFLPARLATVHPHLRTPAWAIGVQSVIVITLALSGGFEKLAILANGSILPVYAACCVAAWELRRRGVQGAGPAFEIRGGAVVPWLALGVVLWLLFSLQRNEWLSLAVVAVGSALYYAMLSSRRRVQALHV